MDDPMTTIYIPHDCNDKILSSMSDLVQTLDIGLAISVRTEPFQTISYVYSAQGLATVPFHK